MSKDSEVKFVGRPIFKQILISKMLSTFKATMTGKAAFLFEQSPFNYLS